MRFESQLSRMCCQMFSTGLSSGALGGMAMMVILDGCESASNNSDPRRRHLNPLIVRPIFWNRWGHRWTPMSILEN